MSLINIDFNYQLEAPFNMIIAGGFTLDKESHTLAIICQDVCVVLAFDNRERLIQWTVRIANNLGEGQQFLVQLASAPPKSKLSPGPVKLHVTDRKFCLTGGIPPRLLGHWEVPHLRRYGIVDGRLVFEGGSRCGKGEGVHVLVPDPPQISLIMDALDMSSKGQLVRGPSRRFGSGVTDSPRKSLSRLSELRSSATASPAPDASMLTPVAIPAANMALMGSAMSPTPRESRSAEALCNACNDPVNGQGGSMWMSSEASSRCDLDSCDNVSVISPEDIGHDHSHIPLKHPASPARTQGQPLQIAKPMPSSMERCLSCMSKLGQQGQDILSPSWTMDLNVTTTTNVGPSSLTSSVTSASNLPQGSIGSGNSDRLSISSHGSSGGVTEYYYDTPRSVLVAEARRTAAAAARSGTPPGAFQNGQMMQSGNHNGGGNPGCSSPYRNPRNNHGCSANGFTSSVSGQQGAQCPSGCHCQNHLPRVMNSSVASSTGHGNSPIYYNGVAEQKAHGGKPPINLHSSGSTAGPGPYENYDFPRCTHPIAYPPVGSASHSSCGCCPSTGGEHPPCGHSSNIDWSKKPPMDRNSIASTAHGSDSASEFYDTPARHHGCSCCAPPSCACCVPGAANSGSGHHHHPSGHHAHSTTSAQHSHYQNPATCFMSHDPMENYDVPPSHPQGGILPSAAKDLQQQHRSVNGEGKMPLVSAHAIYAQVDKTKKTQRSVPPHFGNCDNNHQPIYENHSHHHANPPCQQQQFMAQPTYANLEGPPCKGHSKGKPPAPEPAPVRPNHACQRVPTAPNNQHSHQNPTSNYVNLEYNGGGPPMIYENTQEVKQEPVVAVVTPQKPTVTVPDTSENLVQQSKENNDAQCNDTKKPASDELKVIPEEKEVETKENEYENTRELCTQEPKKAVLETQASDDSIKNESSDPPSVQEESSAISSEEITEANAGTSVSSGAAGTSDGEPSLPLRRSSSVPCKGGHANRGSASSSDSGVSGDGGLFFDDSSPLNDIGSLCLHESLPRKNQRSSPGASGRNTVPTPIPKAQDGEQGRSDGVIESSTKQGESTTEAVESNVEIIDPLLVNRHYETIDESKQNMAGNRQAFHHQPVSNPTISAVKSGEICSVQQPRPKNPLTLVSDANSTSSGASDMSDYIETLSSCSRGSSETVTSIPVNPLMASSPCGNANISVSPRKSSNMKPRSGKEYFKIDRSMFKSD